MRDVLRGIDHHLDRLHAGRDRVALEGREMASAAEIERDAKRPTTPAPAGGRSRDAETDTAAV